jgi:hypothetical protein
MRAGSSVLVNRENGDVLVITSEEYAGSMSANPLISNKKWVQAGLVVGVALILGGSALVLYGDWPYAVLMLAVCSWVVIAMVRWHKSSHRRDT